MKCVPNSLRPFVVDLIDIEVCVLFNSVALNSIIATIARIVFRVQQSE